MTTSHTVEIYRNFKDGTGDYVAVVNGKALYLTWNGEVNEDNCRWFHPDVSWLTKVWEGDHE